MADENYFQSIDVIWERCTSTVIIKELDIERHLMPDHVHIGKYSTEIEQATSGILKNQLMMFRQARQSQVV